MLLCFLKIMHCSPQIHEINSSAPFKYFACAPQIKSLKLFQLLPDPPPPPLNRELHTRRLGSPVTMWFHTRTMGVRGHAPRIVFIKNDANLCILSIPKHVIINLKINNVKDNRLTIKNIDHIFLKYKNQGFRILV